MRRSLNHPDAFLGEGIRALVIVLVRRAALHYASPLMIELTMGLDGARSPDPPQFPLPGFGRPPVGILGGVLREAAAEWGNSRFDLCL